MLSLCQADLQGFPSFSIGHFIDLNLCFYQIYAIESIISILKTFWFINQWLSESNAINLLIVSARVFLMPLMYSKVILNGEISTAQLSYLCI